ncbi:MAG: sugar-transfer associated ATP-grasp domain-containing protein [Boseongicola sp.]
MRLLSIGQKVARVIQAVDYDGRQKTTANRAYQALTEAEPDRSLDESTEREIREYSRAILGSPRFAPWLRFYAAVQGKFLEGWIPDNFFGRVVLEKLQNPRNRRLTGSKTLMRRNLGTDLVPDIASFVRGCWIDPDGEPLSNDSALSLIFQKHDHVIVKADHSARSEGVRRVSKTQFDLDKLSNLGDFVVQEPIRPVAELAVLVEGNLATVRITTVKPNGAPAQARAAFVRFGRASQTIVHADTEIDVAVTDDQGSLGEIGLMPDWSLTNTHPDTGAVFRGIKIPKFAEAADTCCKLHDRVPHLTIIGWDVAIDEHNAVKLLEWNLGHMEINVTEALLGPCFKDLGWETLNSSRSS